MDTEAQIRQIFTQYEHGVAYKNGIGKRGLYQQNRINERFYAGDQCMASIAATAGRWCGTT